MSTSKPRRTTRRRVVVIAAAAAAVGVGLVEMFLGTGVAQAAEVIWLNVVSRP
jgi:uncharacterized membrane protein